MSNNNESSSVSNRGEESDREDSNNDDLIDMSVNNGSGFEEEENEEDTTTTMNNTNEDYFDLERLGQMKRRHRKALDIKNNGLSTDGLQVMLDRYDTNVRFIESIQNKKNADTSLVDEMNGQSASQIYTRCSKRDTFTETHVGDDIMATFSTIRDYRAACDMQRMDADRFQQVFDQFAAWDESQYEEFKRNYTLEYVFRRILQRDPEYRSAYMRLLKQCQESTDYSRIDRPLLPLPTPKFLTGDSQLELCNSSLRSKLRNMRRRETNGSSSDESSPESVAFLARLNDAVSSFFRRLDFVDESSWPTMMQSQSPSDAKCEQPMEEEESSTDAAEDIIKTEINNGRKGGGRKRSAGAMASKSIIGAKKRTATMAKFNLSMFPKKAFRAPRRTDSSIKPKLEPELFSPPPSSEIYSNVDDDESDLPDHSASSPAIVDAAAAALADAERELEIQRQQLQPRRSSSLLASKRPSAFIKKSSSKMSINNISMLMMKKAMGKNGSAAAFVAPQISTILSNGFQQQDRHQSDEPLAEEETGGVGSLRGVGADEPIDEEDLKSILADLAGMHAVVTCEELGRLVEHGSVAHPEWGAILVRHGRVVRLGTAKLGFQAPAARMEFQFPMERLTEFIPTDKIRFDDERNLYLNGVLTDFYFLQS